MENLVWMPWTKARDPGHVEGIAPEEIIRRGVKGTEILLRGFLLSHSFGHRIADDSFDDIGRGLLPDDHGEIVITAPTARSLAGSIHVSTGKEILGARRPRRGCLEVH